MLVRGSRLQENEIVAGAGAKADGCMVLKLSMNAAILCSFYVAMHRFWNATPPLATLPPEPRMSHSLRITTPPTLI